MLSTDENEKKKQKVDIKTRSTRDNPAEKLPVDVEKSRRID